MDLCKKLVKNCFTTFHLCRSCKLLGRETVKAYRFSTGKVVLEKSFIHIII